MLRKQIKDKFNSTINHVKAHPALYAYAAGAAIGITSTYLLTDYFMKDALKDLKLVDLNAALKRIHEEGLTGLKYEMGAETLVLFPVDSCTLNDLT